MQISSYDDLVKTVRMWTNRKDLTDDEIQSFTFLAGSQANQVLKVPAMERTRLVEVSEDGKIIIPDDYIELRSLTAYWNDDSSVPLERVAWDQFLNYRNNESVGGMQPRFFARQGPYIWLTPEPPVGAMTTVHYYGTIPSIDSANPINWLIQFSPMTYLYGSLHYAYLYLMDEERAEYWNQKFIKEMERVQYMADGSEYKGSSLTIRLRETSGVR